MSNSDKQHYHGHRSRLRQKLLEHGESLADYEILEMILMHSRPRGDVKPLAKTLIKHFGSLPEVITAPADRLLAVKGVGTAAAAAIKLAHRTSLVMLAHKIDKKHVISSWQDVLDYCKVALAYYDREQFCLIYLDRKNHVIDHEIIQAGTVDHVTLYPREIVKSALAKGATAVIMVHNHPSGILKPSRDDIELTQVMEEVFIPLKIVLHDHLIVTPKGHFSFRHHGLLKDNKGK